MPITRDTASPITASLLTTIGVTLLSFSSQAAGQTRGHWYFGASASDVSEDFERRIVIGETRSLDEGRGFKLAGGVRPLEPLLIELDYLDLGTAELRLWVYCLDVVGIVCPDQGVLRNRGVSVSAIGLLTISRLEVFGRFGVARWRSDRQILDLPTRRETDTEILSGIGAQIRLGAFALRLEFERLDLPRDSAESLSLGFTYALR